MRIAVAAAAMCAHAVAAQTGRSSDDVWAAVWGARGEGDDMGSLGVHVACGQLCGNGVIDGVEECDDGNRVDGDGCSSVCTREII